MRDSRSFRDLCFNTEFYPLDGSYEFLFNTKPSPNLREFVRDLSFIDWLLTIDENFLSVSTDSFYIRTGLFLCKLYHFLFQCEELSIVVLVSVNYTRKCLLWHSYSKIWQSINCKESKLSFFSFWVFTLYWKGSNVPINHRFSLNFKTRGLKSKLRKGCFETVHIASQLRGTLPVLNVPDSVCVYKNYLPSTSLRPRIVFIGTHQRLRLYPSRPVHVGFAHSWILSPGTVVSVCCVCCIWIRTYTWRVDTLYIYF